MSLLDAITLGVALGGVLPLQGDLDLNGHNITNVKDLKVDGLMRAKWYGGEVIYVSPTGGGDGSSPSSPTTLDDALTRAITRNVTIFLLDGTYNIDENYTIAGNHIVLASHSGDATLCTIVFNSYSDGTYNRVYHFTIVDNCRLDIANITLENAAKADATLPWEYEGGCSIRLDRRGNSVVYFRGCTINQSTPYFINTKHSSGDVIFVGTTINMSGDAVGHILTAFGTVRIGWWNSTITSGYKLTDGVQGINVLCSHNLNTISASQTWFSQVPENVLPNTDNTLSLGSSTLRWTNLYLAGTIVRPDSGTMYKTDNDDVMITHHDGYGNFQIMTGGTPWGGASGANRGYAEIELDYELQHGKILFNVAQEVTTAGTSFDIKGISIDSAVWSLRPTVDNFWNLGTNTLRWAKGYFASGVITRVDVGDYGGAFSLYTPPTGEEGMIIVAIDTNATTPGKRLYVYANGAWNYVDLS